MTILNPHIYVVCLAAYHAGILHGQWIDANQDVSELHDAIQTMLSKSPVRDAEEWAIHDTEDFGDITVKQYQGLESISKMAAFIVEHGELGAALINNLGYLEDAEQAMEECYRGVFKNEEKFAEQYIKEIEPVPEYLDGYINYEKLARDLFISDFFTLEVAGGMHVFRDS
jgi:antirestriction protein